VKGVDNGFTAVVTVCNRWTLSSRRDKPELKVLSYQVGRG
jgi:hypothetical protein